MDLKGILSISGHSGLFKMVSQTKNGIIVESLIDKKRMQAYATSKISSLEDIALFTTNEDIPLTKVFMNIFKKENGGSSINPKSDSEILKKYFLEILPDYDRERVYVSDIKRVISWYNILLEHGYIKEEEENTENQDENKETTESNSDQTEQ